MALRAGDLALLEALLDAGTASGAAKRLGVEQSTVSRRLAALEERVGQPLFVRATSGLVATPLAERLGRSARALGGALRAAERVLEDGDAEPSGLVRVALPEAFAHFVITPRLRGLAERYPALRIAVDDGPDVVDLGRVEAHLAVRAQRPSAGDVTAKLLMDERLGFFGTSAYLGDASFDACEVLGWDAGYAHLPEARLLARHEVRTRLTFCRMSTMVSAARAGAGLLLTTPIFAAHLGLVEAPGSPALAPRSQLYLAAPTALRQSPAVAAVWSWVEGVIADAPHAL
ncbi:MAG: LysR family transcriptional regulator [Myxococcota bacterium]